MSIGISSGMPIAARTAEMREGPGPDRVDDNDGDDAAAAAPKAPPAPIGMGKIVDKTA